MFASVVIGKGKSVHALKSGLTVLCGKYASEDGSGWLEDGTAITCKSCVKRMEAETVETLFTLETVTEVSADLEVEREYHPTMAYVAASMAPTETVVELETVESETTETEPSDAEIMRMMASSEIAETVLTGYTANEWIDVMLSTDTHHVDMSRGLAVERIYMTKQAARKAKREAAELERVERNARRAEAAERAETARTSDAYMAMSWIMGGLRTRGVVMTLTGDTVRVESLTWRKGERNVPSPVVGNSTSKMPYGDVAETVATFTVGEDGMVTITETGGKRHTVTVVRAIAIFMDILPERSKDLMPRKYRDVMRTHRAKNRAVVDATGNRAAKRVDAIDPDVAALMGIEPEPVTLTVETLNDYAATLESRADGLKTRTSGKRSMQGVKLTEAERRESDRARQAAYRARKLAEKMAEIA